MTRAFRYEKILKRSQKMTKGTGPKFFYAVEDRPRDLIGTPHNLLVRFCYKQERDEWVDQNPGKRYPVLGHDRRVQRALYNRLFENADTDVEGVMV